MYLSHLGLLCKLVCGGRVQVRRGGQFGLGLVQQLVNTGQQLAEVLVVHLQVLVGGGRIKSVLDLW